MFLPKNTTSRLQPLDAGIIRNFKLKYRKKLLKFVISRINDNVKATDIIQEVDVLKAISWIKSAWGEVSEETIVNCFKKCGFQKSQPDVQLTDFAEEEEFESLVKELSTDVSATEYINFDREVVISQPSIDVNNIAWRQESRQNAIDTVMEFHNDQEHLKDNESDDEEVTIDDSLAIESISEALQVVDRITCFTRQYEDGEINELLEVVTEKLQDIIIRNRQQKKITDYFDVRSTDTLQKKNFFFTIPHSHSQVRGRRSPCESGSSVKQPYLKFGNFSVQTSLRRTPL